MAGAVFAARASRFAEVTLFEREEHLGGLHKSPCVNGFHYDVGAFFFEENHPVFTTFPGLIDDFVPFDMRVRSVGDGGGQDVYPITVRGFIRNQGLGTLARALGSIAAAKWRHRRRDTVSSFCRYYIGDVVYERSGLRTYIERLYGMPDREIDLAFATQRMSSLASWAGIRSILRQIRSSPAKLWSSGYYQPIALARPREGFRFAYDKIRDQLRAAGVDVRTGAALRSIERDEQGFTVDADGFRDQFDLVVSTAPIGVTARLMGMPTTHRFETRSLLTLFYSFDGDPGFDAVALNNFSNTGRWKRIVDFAGCYGVDAGVHHLSVEITVSDGEVPDIDRERASFEQHVRQLGLLRDGLLRYEGHHLTPNAYPILRLDQARSAEAAKRRLEECGVMLAGRQGQFEYLSSKQAATSAIALAEAISR